MSKRKAFSDQIDWFYTHCAAHHEAIRTQKGMIDVAIWAMRQVKDHFLIREVTPTVKADFANMLCTTHKCMGTMPIFHCHKYTTPILNKLVELQDDPGFTEKELYSRHAFAERTLHGGGNRNRLNNKKVDPDARKAPIPVSQSASSKNVGTVPTAAPSPTNRSASTNNVLDTTTAASPSNQTVSTQVTTPPTADVAEW
jgi:hypothetical protein